jgi:dTDP-glucose pyrophosphorylase
MFIKDWKHFIVFHSTQISTVVELLEKNQLVVVTDKDRRLVGTITDRDLRRGLLVGAHLDDSAGTIMNKGPEFIESNESLENAAGTPRKRNFFLQYPVVTKEGRVIGILDATSSDYHDTRNSNEVVIMSGGKGSRLGARTANVPKALIKVGGFALIDHVINNFTKSGFHKFSISVHHFAHQIKKHFVDQTYEHLKIRYVEEAVPLGTVGALHTFTHHGDQPFFVVNCDVISPINPINLLDFHMTCDADVTVCVVPHLIDIPFGVVETNGEDIVSIEEKPTKEFLVSAGMYVLSPVVLRFLEGGCVDAPELVKTCIKNGMKVVAYRVIEEWVDVGVPENLLTAENFLSGYKE